MFIHLVPQHRIFFKLSLRINGSSIRISHYQKQKHYDFQLCGLWSSMENMYRGEYGKSQNTTYHNKMRGFKIYSR